MEEVYSSKQKCVPLKKDLGQKGNHTYIKADLLQTFNRYIWREYLDWIDRSELEL